MSASTTGRRVHLPVVCVYSRCGQAMATPTLITPLVSSITSLLLLSLLPQFCHIEPFCPICFSPSPHVFFADTWCHLFRISFHGDRASACIIPSGYEARLHLYLKPACYADTAVQYGSRGAEVGRSCWVCVKALWGRFYISMFFGLPYYSVEIL